MRTTVRIDDELLADLRRQAARESLSLTDVVNRALRRGLAASNSTRRRPVHRERTFSMGSPRVPLDKALALAAALDDDEAVRKLLRGK